VLHSLMEVEPPCRSLFHVCLNLPRIQSVVPRAMRGSRPVAMQVWIAMSQLPYSLKGGQQFFLVLHRHDRFAHAQKLNIWFTHHLSLFIRGYSLFRVASQSGIKLSAPQLLSGLYKETIYKRAIVCSEH
jgi:hypothetical protein